jgi:GT2 family glycosyltransferase
MNVEGICDVDEQDATLRPLVSVVIAVRNGMPFLEAQLCAVASQKLSAEWEVVVADNGSQDSTGVCVEHWAEFVPRIRLVDAAFPRGPGAARNAGVKAAGGSLLVFCDADDVVQPDWLARMVAALDEHDVVSGVYDFGSPNGGSGRVATPHATAQMGFLPFGLGANLAVRREAFEAVSGFQESFLVGEDIDLCWRLQLAGYRFSVADAAVVRKREPTDAGSILRKAWSYGRCGARLYREYRAAGMHRDLRGASKAWVWLLVNVTRLFRLPVRRRWLRTFGIRAGRLAGSMTQHAFFP